MIRTFMLLFALSAALSVYAQGYSEEIGKAAYYADKLHGRPTASGKPYDKDALTCSHKKYPFGTELRITRLDNNKSVVVTVTDRGPYHEGFVVDLSRKAAEAIDLIKDGVTRVKVEPANSPSTGSAAPPVKPVEVGERMGGNVQLIKAHTPEPVAVKPVANNSQLTAKSAPVTAPKSAPSVMTPKTPPTTAKSAPALTTAKAPAEPAAAKQAKPAAKVEKSAKPETAPVAAKTAKVRDLYQLSLKKPAKEGFGVQVGVLSNINTAFQEAAKLEVKWPGKVLLIVETDEAAGSAPLYKLLIGPYADRKTADQAQTEAMRKGFRKAFVVDMSAQ